MRQAILGFVVLSSIAVSATDQKRVWVEFIDASGKEIMGFAVQQEPYAPGRQPRVGGALQKLTRDSHDHVISGYGFYGWMDGDTVRVVLLVQVPIDGAENRQYPMESRQLRYEELTRYALPVGATRNIVEAKTIGLRVLTMRTGLRD